MRPGGVGPVSSLLERFRRSAGVPAVVGEEVSAELAPVFAVLDEIEQEAGVLRDRSEADASLRLGRATAEAESILAAGRERAALERDDAFRSVLREADGESDAIISQADAEAEAIRRKGEARLPKLVSEILARVIGAPG
jgi:vacuolar-type H+-ATPase subunit H